MKRCLTSLLVGIVPLVALSGAAFAATPVWDKPLQPAAPKAPPKMTIEYATTVFKELAGRGDICFGYKANGCYARTHLMHKHLKSLGIESGTVWAFANNPKVYKLPNLPDNLIVRLGGGNTVQWWYNNAPVIMVEDGYGDLTPYVLDPALFDRPVLVGEWLARQMGGDIKTPYITFSRLGEAPILPNGNSTGGSGYHPGPDPNDGLDANAEATMKDCFSKLAAPATPATPRLPF